jgi:hypothetical protein
MPSRPPGFECIGVSPFCFSIHRFSLAKRAVAKASFVRKEPNYLSFDQGDIVRMGLVYSLAHLHSSHRPAQVEVLDDSEKWWHARNADGLEGLVRCRPGLLVGRLSRSPPSAADPKQLFSCF